jgi:hypothetical protein
MRLLSEAPANPIETNIEEILVESGIRREDIQFRDEDRYLRVGYWERLSENAKDRLGDLITSEEPMYDDDCGWLFLYHISKA